MKTADQDNRGFILFQRNAEGFTLVEVIFAMAILAILATISTKIYTDYVEKAKLYTAMDKLIVVATEISSYGMDSGVYPLSLAEIGCGGLLDPWGNPYRYKNIKNSTGVSGMRKDKFLVPINTDFDLYSMGPDGLTMLQLNHKDSRDDIIRANDGQYIGPAEGF